MGGFAARVPWRGVGLAVPATVVVVVLAGVAIAGTTKIGGNLTIATHPCGAQDCDNNIHGRVSSPANACEDHRLVVLHEAGGGDYSARDRTDESGRWKTHDVPQGSQPTDVVAVATRRELSGDRVCRRVATAPTTWNPPG